MEFDHLFITTSVGAPEADRLLRAGFAEGEPNVHSGQGSSCRRFFFQNAYLEFLWVENESEARAAPVERTQLWERWCWERTGASPFGIGLRPSSMVSATIEAVERTGVVRFGRGEAHAAEVVLDGGRQWGSIDLMPHLPLTLRW